MRRTSLLIAALGMPALLALVACSDDNGAVPSAPTQTLEEPSPTPATRSATGRLPQNAARADLDVTYCTADSVELKMDVFYPSGTFASPRPAVMYVHGGGFTGGDKGGGAGTTDMPELLRRGYLVTSVNYRLAPRYPFPAAIEDVKCAVRYLRANASKYGIDPGRIGAWGGSAGGNLVSLLGTADVAAGLEGNGGFAGVPSRVQAAVDFFGPSDFSSSAVTSRVPAYLTGSGATLATNAARASPVTFVSPDDPPFLILHGDRDTVVPLAQSQVLYERLKATGVPVEFTVVKNGGHGFTPTGGAITPSRTEISRMVADFFDRYLKPG